MLTAEQVQARRHSIGGSDAATAIGLNPYKTPYQLWLEKTGRVEPEDLSGNERIHFGNVLEDVVADEFARRTGKKVRRNNRLLVHPEFDFITANLDREVVGEKSILEFKTTDKLYGMTDDWGEEGTDEVPVTHLLQSHHYIGVTGKDVCSLGALIGGNEYRTYKIERDEDLLKDLFDQEREFWHRHVKADVAPDVSNEKDLLLKYGYPKKDTEKQAVDLIMEYCWRLREAKMQIKDIEKTHEWMDLAIKDYMGESTVLKSDESILATWKRQTAKRLNQTALREAHPDIVKEFTEAGESRRFLLK